jgi:hypothetical protein
VPANRRRPPRGMGVVAPPWPSASFQTRPRPPARRCEHSRAVAATTAYKYDAFRESIFSFPVFATATTAAPPLAAAAAKPPPATQTAPIGPPHPRTSSGLLEFTVFAPKPLHRLLPCPPPATDRHRRPHVASHFPCLSASTDHGFMYVTDAPCPLILVSTALCAPACCSRVHRAAIAVASGSPELKPWCKLVKRSRGKV